MKILIAPDSYKGSLSATEVAAALSRGLRSVLPDSSVKEQPLSDGGEGTIEVLRSCGFQLHEADITDHQGRPITASYALKGRTAVIESAEACPFEPGATPHHALGATTRGVGMLIKKALEHPVSHIMLTLGGTATTDGGLGMLHELGAKATDKNGVALGPGGGALVDLAHIDLSNLDARLAGISFTVLTDVDNPLLGPRGATAVFAPQKGADARAQEILEKGMKNFSDLLDPIAARQPGTGAGGGLGYAAQVGLGATGASGAHTMMDLVDVFGESYDLIITGEGSFDDQSLHGKIPGAIIEHATTRGTPVLVVCGVAGITDATALQDATVVAVLALSSFEPDRAASLANASQILETVGQWIGGKLAATPIADVRWSPVA
jgi:glycerate kinase